MVDASSPLAWPPSAQDLGHAGVPGGQFGLWPCIMDRTGSTICGVLCKMKLQEGSLFKNYQEFQDIGSRALNQEQGSSKHTAT